MEQVQMRAQHGLLERVDALVDAGLYANRSDAIRDAIRRLVLNKMIGIMRDTGDSVKEVRKLRKKLSKEKFNLKEINALAK